MRTRINQFILLFLVVVFPAKADEPHNQDSANLDYLVQAVGRLKGKTIPQAYFWLGSPQIPDSTIFAPDTKGGAFVIIVRNRRLADGSVQVFYTEDDWAHLVKAVMTWTVARAEISGVASANQWRFTEDEILVLRIPQATNDFFKALLEGWKTNETDFRCGTYWN